jgi:hypothetical protein
MQLSTSQAFFNEKTSQHIESVPAIFSQWQHPNYFHLFRYHEDKQKGRADYMRCTERMTTNTRNHSPLNLQIQDC